DFRGHGGSDWNEDGIYHSAEHLLDLQNVVYSILPENFYIIAHSMGAGIAARYTGLFPEKIKGLVCLEGFSGLQTNSLEKSRLRNWMDSMAKKTGKKETIRRKISKEEAAKKLSYIYPYLSMDKIVILAEGLTKSMIGGDVTWKNDPRLKVTSPIPFPPELSRELWRSITCPVLMIYGEKTHLKPDNLEEIKSHFKNLSYKEIIASSHNMHHDNPEECLHLIKEFFKIILG
ncbi:MAG: alpha/beta hydrolase, partial [Spirochaetia bacterium]|nr:alpha/beta hydrolase [Spirochaetia bacterium]